MTQWIMFCEAAADFRTAAELIDELLRLRCSQWVRDLLQSDANSLRSWYEDRPGRSWFDIHHVYKTAERLNVSLSYGHFGGQPAAPGALMLATIFGIVRRLQK